MGVDEKAIEDGFHAHVGSLPGDGFSGRTGDCIIIWRTISSRRDHLVLVTSRHIFSQYYFNHFAVLKRARLPCNAYFSMGFNLYPGAGLRMAFHPALASKWRCDGYFVVLVFSGYPDRNIGQIYASTRSQN